MSANFLPKTPRLNEWLLTAAQKLAAAGIDSARLDAEIILAHTLRKSRTYLHAHGDEVLDPRHHEIVEARLELRLDRTPIAYIVGHKEFYGRLFKVTPATLVPRPESETIIDLLKETLDSMPSSLFKEETHLVDIGTGTGCLGITAKLEIPNLQVTLSDISNHALNVAQANASALKCDVTLTQSNLLENYSFTPTFILANLPYVDPSWQQSPELAHEPAIALFAKEGGLELIFKLLEQSQLRLAPHGSIFLEADPRQHTAIIEKAAKLGFKVYTKRGFILQLQKN